MLNIFALMLNIKANINGKPLFFCLRKIQGEYYMTQNSQGYIQGEVCFVKYEILDS